MNVVPFLSEKLWHILLCKNASLEFLLSGDQTVDLRSNMKPHYRKIFKRTFGWASLRCCCSSGSRGVCQFVEKYWKRPNFTFGDLWWPDLWLDLRMIKAVSSCFWRSFECRLQRVDTWPRRRIREGTVHPPRPGATYMTFRSSVYESNPYRI